MTQNKSDWLKNIRNKGIYGLLTTVVLISAFTIIVSLKEGYDTFDSIWWSVVTFTTVGYGDIAPLSFGGKIFGILLVLAGISLILSLYLLMLYIFLANNYSIDSVIRNLSIYILSLSVVATLLFSLFERGKICSLDAAWWAATTITTVGYGDIYPITFLGRMVGIVVMLSSILIFCIILSTLTTWVIRRVMRNLL